MSNVESRAIVEAAPSAGSSSYGGLSAVGGGSWPADGSLARTIEHELVPRLLLAHRAGPLSPAAQAALAAQAAVAAPPRPLVGRVCADDRHEFLARVLGADEDGPVALVRELVEAGIAVESVYLDLLAPTAVTLGHLWDADECDFLDVTIALGRLQRVMREIGQLGTPMAVGTGDAGQVLLASLQGEQHTLGLYMVAEFFLRDGWGVQVLAPQSMEELTSAVRESWVDVVGFSVACDARLLKLRHEIASVRRHARNPRLTVLVGGRVFAEHPELVSKVGADGYAATAADAPTCARQLRARARA